MSDPTALLIDQQELISVLAAYRTAECGHAIASRPAETASSDATRDNSESIEADSDTGWIPRLRDLPGIAADRLAPLHGQLIAHGLLRFNLLGRTAGVGYRVTPEGRSLLASGQLN